MDAADPPSTEPLPPPPLPPPPPAAPPFQGRRLRRRPEEGVVAGICAGIADYLDVDVTVVRFAAVLLAVMGPGIPAYLVGWVVIPRAAPGEPRSQPGGGRRSSEGFGEQAPQFVGAALLVIAGLVVWDRLDWPGHELVLPLVLIGAGVALLARREPLFGADDTSGPGGATVARPDERPWAPPPPTTPPPPTAPPPPPPLQPRRSRVGPAVFGVTLVWGGIAALAGVSLQTGLAVAVGLLGVGLVVGAFVGRARWLIVPGILLSAALVATSAIDVPLRGGIGERTWLVASAADAEEPFRLALGNAVLDLRRLRPGPERTVTVEATVAVGHLQVLIPDGVDLTIDAAAHVGEVVILGRADEGMDVRVRQAIETTGSSAGRIELDVAVGVGQVEVLG